jgi:hypothetical protein
MTFALTAYGQWLVRRHGLAMRLQASLFPDQPVWKDQAFELLRLETPAPSAVDITTARFEHPSAIPLLERAIAIKALATLLRFAYLADAPVQRVWWLPPLAASAIPTASIQASLLDGACVELRAVRDDCSDPEGHVLMVQSGHPDRWFDTERWSALAPILRQHGAGQLRAGPRALRHALFTLLAPPSTLRRRIARSRQLSVATGSDHPTALPERKARVARADKPAPLR